MQIGFDTTLAPVAMFFGCCVVFLLGYIVVRARKKGRERLVECYVVIATGNITELLLALYLVIFAVQNVGPVGQFNTIGYFLTLVFFMVLWSAIQWFDIFYQWIDLKRQRIQ
ncbi:MAG: hypothetical protein ACFFDQ_10130 [Candidatus Thorarchaeota archaeon]